MSLNMDKVRNKIQDIHQALEDSDMGEVETHMMTLQKMLQATPHIVDVLLPEDIGVMVTAERKRMKEDILAASIPTKRASTRKRKPKVQLDMNRIQSLDLGDDW